MSYTALYRKFRPMEFSDVKGQNHIVTTLKNQICANRIGHAYLFCGTRGTGKTTIAKIFAKAVNCEHPKDGNPCGECDSCKAIAAGVSMNVIEIDAASNNGVDNIREIKEEVAYSPTEGKYKVYIIDEVHMLSVGAFNALLKTLEEPPSYVIFILATTEAHKIPITILSRCQRYDFRRITVETIVARLKELTQKEKIEVEDKAFAYIAKAADGSMRDALSLLDQCIAFHLGQTLTYDNVIDVLGAVDFDVFSLFFQKICEQNVLDVLKELEQIILQGRELSQFVLDFIWYLRNLLMLRSSGGMEEMIDASTEHLEQMKKEAQFVDAETLMRYIRIFSGLSDQLKYASQKRVLVEIALVKLCKPEMERDYDSILHRLSQLEQKMEQGLSIPQVQAEIPRLEKVEEAKIATQKISPEALTKDVQELIAHFQEITRKMGHWSQIVLKDAQLRELAEHNGVQIILSEEYPINEKDLEEELEAIIEKQLHVKMKVLVCTPNTDSRQQEPVIDLSKSINMNIEILD